MLVDLWNMGGGGLSFVASVKGGHNAEHLEFSFREQSQCSQNPTTEMDPSARRMDGPPPLYGAVFPELGQEEAWIWHLEFIPVSVGCWKSETAPPSFSHSLSLDLRRC